MDGRNTFINGDVDTTFGKMKHFKRIGGCTRWTLCIFLIVLLWNTADSQIRYTIPEELKEGSVVGNIAKDLGLEISAISDRRLRIDYIRTQWH